MEAIHWTSETALWILLLIIGWFVRDKLRSIELKIGYVAKDAEKNSVSLHLEVEKVSAEVKDHKENCAHTTPAEKRLRDELIDYKFVVISSQLADLSHKAQK